MTPTSVWRALRKRLLPIVLLAVLGAAAAFGLSSRTAPTYESTTTLYFTLNFGNSASDLAQGSTYTANQMTSFGSLVTTSIVLDPVIVRLGLDTDSRALARQVTVSTPRDTVVMRITVSSNDPQRAADIANALAAQEQIVVAQLAPRNAAGNPTVNVTTIQPATVPIHQSTPNKKLDTVLGGVIGLLVGVGGALLRDVLDSKVRSPEVLAELTDQPFLGSLRTRGSDVEQFVMMHQPANPAAEDFRKLRSNLRFTTGPKRPLVLLVTGATAGEGKTSTACNLAVVMAESGERVLLLDGDLRRPSVAKLTQLVGSVGLTDVLVGSATIEEAVQPLGAVGVDVLTAGTVPPDAGKLASSPQVGALLAEARTQYDIIVIDTAPVLAVADATAMALHSDGVLLVARVTKLKKQALHKALDNLETAGNRLYGIVLNDVRTATKDYHSYESEHPTVDMTPPVVTPAPAPPGDRPPAAAAKAVPGSKAGPTSAREEKPRRDDRVGATPRPRQRR